MYISLNGNLPIMDMVGVKGLATLGTMGTQMIIAAVAMVVGYFYNRKQAQ
jgi:hypothetical protein